MKHHGEPKVYVRDLFTGKNVHVKGSFSLRDTLADQLSNVDTFLRAGGFVVDQTYNKSTRIARTDTQVLSIVVVHAGESAFDHAVHSSGPITLSAAEAALIRSQAMYRLLTEFGIDRKKAKRAYERLDKQLASGTITSFKQKKRIAQWASLLHLNDDERNEEDQLRLLGNNLAWRITTPAVPGGCQIVYRNVKLVTLANALVEAAQSRLRSEMLINAAQSAARDLRHHKPVTAIREAVHAIAGEIEAERTWIDKEISERGYETGAHSMHSANEAEAMGRIGVLADAIDAVLRRVETDYDSAEPDQMDYYQYDDLGWLSGTVKNLFDVVDRKMAFIFREHANMLVLKPLSERLQKWDTRH